MPEIMDVVGLAVGATSTILVFLYLLDTKPFYAIYRLILHVFIGLLVGYSFGIAIRDVLVSKLLLNLLNDPLSVVVPLLLGMFLLSKAIPRRAFIGTLSVAYLVGIGTAVALGGVLLGTLLPQIEATGRALSPTSTASYQFGLIDGLLIVIGTVCTLMAFTFTAQKGRGLSGLWYQVARVTGGIGRLFLIGTFGVVFASALTASLSIFIGRIQYLIDAFTELYFSIRGLLS